MFEALLILLGLVGLFLGSQLVIKGALNIAEHLKISHTFIGLTIFAIGTDLPEFTIAVSAAYKHLQGVETGGLIIGEAVGSSIANIALVLSIVAIITVVILKKSRLMREGLIMAGSIVLLFLLGIDGKISRFDGMVLILIYLFYLLSLQREEKIFEKISRAPKIHLAWDSLSLIGGFIILGYFSQIIVDNSVFLASAWGVSQTIIGLLIIGPGTSLPELMVSIEAMRNGSSVLSVSNIIGSNIFNSLIIPGVGAVIAGFAVEKSVLYFDIPVLFVVSLLVIGIFSLKGRMGRKEGIALLGIYAAYAIAKVLLR